jgi:hypothetical protein
VTVRSILSGIALAFTAYLSARSLLWTLPETVERGWLLIAALVIYLPITWLWVLLPTRHHEAATGGASADTRAAPPRWALALAVLAAVLVPNAAFAAVNDAGRAQPFVTWVIGGIGALMTVVMVRRRPAIAWIGTGLLSLSAAVWLGPLSALSLGLVGSLVWVAAAQLITFALDRVARDAEQLSELQQAASAWQASQSGRQRERRLHVQRALHVAGPVLGRTIETGGNLRPSEKSAARLAEQSLRDELRSPRLLDDGVRAQIDAARRRGTIVMLFDEGGLEDLPASALSDIRTELARVVRDAASERLIIRTSPHHEVAVTVVGRTATAGAGADEDDVDLWREIRRPS